MVVVERLLAELTRLNNETAAATASRPCTESCDIALDQFSVVSASSLAPEAVVSVSHRTPGRPFSQSPFALPRVRLTSPYKDGSRVKKELETMAHPLYALDRLDLVFAGKMTRLDSRRRLKCHPVAYWRKCPCLRPGRC